MTSENEIYVTIALRNLKPNCTAQISSVEVKLEPSSSPISIDCIRNLMNPSEMVCTGALKAVNYLNLCVSNRVEIRPVFPNVMLDSKWIAATLEPLVTASDGAKHGIQVNQAPPYLVQWNNPTCLIGRVPFWNILIVDNSTGYQSGIWYLPDDCSKNSANNYAVEVDFGKPKFKHGVFLSTTQDASCVEAYRWMQELASCSTYMIKVVPLNTDKYDIKLDEASNPKIELTTSFQPSGK